MIFTFEAMLQNLPIFTFPEKWQVGNEKAPTLEKFLTGIVEYCSAMTLSSIAIFSPFDKRKKFLSL